MAGPWRRIRALVELGRVLRGDPVEDPANWSVIVELARELNVAPGLWRALQESPAIVAPAEVREALRREHAHNALRNLQLRGTLLEAVAALNAAGIVPLLLKGGLQLVDGSLVSVGDRWMIDLDLVVPSAAVPRALEAMASIGYRPYPEKPFMHPHEVPLFRRWADPFIELHTELGSAPIPGLLPVQDVWERSRELQLEGGLHAAGMAATDQILHSVLHAGIQDRNHRVGGLPLRHLLTLSRLQRHHGLDIDWSRVQALMDEAGLGTVLWDHLWLAHRFAGLDAPAFIEDTFRRRLHELRVCLGLGLGWPPELQRNLEFALGREYLDSLYAHGDRAAALAASRVRHLVRVARRDRRRALGKVVQRKL